ncbi:hypothetical protein C0995_004736 [Termitomyces sp. Mi166|nr:hypothetical protein C0995_004736 [Termitomyces sp. Mi166\
MSVTEADSSVLPQTLTNGDISTAHITHDTSTESKENVQPQEELDVHAAEPVGKATEILVETPNNVLNVRAPIIPSDSDVVLTVNGDTEAHATDGASRVFEDTVTDILSVTVKEEAKSTSSTENIITEPKEVVSNQQPASIEREETLTETAKEKSADTVATLEVSAPAPDAMPIAAEAVSPTNEVSNEKVLATVTELKFKKSTVAQPEPTDTASTNAAADSTSSLVQPVASSVSEEPIPVKPEPELEVVSKIVMSDATSEDIKTLSIETPSTSAAEPVVELAPSEAIELGISASQPTEAKTLPEEEVAQAEAATNAAEAIPVTATGAEEVPAHVPAVEIAEATANETPVAEDAAKTTPAPKVASAVELATAVVTSEVRETSTLVEPVVVALPVEATVVPETVPPATPEAEGVKESIVEPSVVVEEAVPHVAEPVTESVVEPVTSAEVALKEEAAVPELIIKEESTPVNVATVSSEPTQPVSTEVHVPSEDISKGASASTEAPVSVPVEEASTTAPAELLNADDRSTDVSSTESSAEIPSEPTIVLEVAVAEADADIHTLAALPTNLEEPVIVKEKAVAEESVAEPLVPEVAEPAKEVAEVAIAESVKPNEQSTEVPSSTGPSVEIESAPATAQEATSAEPAAVDADVHPTDEESAVEGKAVAEEVIAEPVIPEAVEPAKEEVAIVTPPVETTVAPETVPEAAPETEAVEESTTEPSTVVEEVAPPAAKLATESAAEPVTSAEDAPNEEATASEPIVKEESAPVDNAVVSSEPAQLVATIEVHKPSEAVSGDVSPSTETPASVAAELPIASDQPTEVSLSTGPIGEIPSAPTTVHEVAIVESAAADTDAHAPVQIPAEVEEPVAEIIDPEVTEPAKDVEAATAEFVEPSASEVVSEQVTTSALVVQDEAPAVTEHTELSIEPESAAVSDESSEVSQQAPADAESTAASEDITEALPIPATQDDVPSTTIAIAEAPSSNEVAASTEATAPLSQTVTVEESAVKDVDVLLDVASATEHLEPVIEQPASATLPVEQSSNIIEDSATAKEAPVKMHATTPAATQNNEDATVAEVLSSEVGRDHPAAETLVSTQEIDPPVLSEDNQELSPAETPAFVAEEQSPGAQEVSTESALTSKESVETSVVEAVTSNDETVAQPSVSIADQESADPREGADSIEQPRTVIDQEPVLYQEADTEQQEAISEKTPATPTVTTVDEPISDPEPAASKDDHSVTEHIEVISTVEEAASTPAPEVLSAEKEATVVDQVQPVLVEEIIPNSVETLSEAGIEKPTSALIAEVPTQHDEIRATVEEESTLTKQAEVVVESEDNVELPKDVPAVESSTLEEATPAPTPDAVSAEKGAVAEEVQANAVVEKPSPVETGVRAAVEEIGMASSTEAVVAKHEELPLAVEDERLEVTKPQDRIESPEDVTSAAERTTTENVTAEPIDIPPVTTNAAGETPIEEPTLSQDEVETVIATVPSVSEPVNVAEIPAEAVDLLGSVEVPGNEPKEIVEENNAPHVGADVERPKSPYLPSFQVTTVGRGVSPDEQLTEPGAAEPIVDSFTETKMETAEAEELYIVEKVSASVPATVDAKEIMEDVHIEQPLISPPQLVIDESSLEPIEVEKASQVPAQEPRSWPSYSIHTQGSPCSDNAELEVEAQERPRTPSSAQSSLLPIQANLVEEPTSQDEGSFVDNEGETVELEEMKFADNEDAPATVSSAPIDQQTQSQEVAANTSDEQRVVLAEVAPPLTADETSHPLESTETSDEAAFDSVHTKPEDSSETIVPHMEQNNQGHVLQVEDGVKSSPETAAPVINTEVPLLVLDAKEVSAPSAFASEQISEVLASHVAERPASPWIPSYSVIVQGSPAHEHANPLDKGAVATTELDMTESDVELEAPVVEQIEAPTTLAKNIAETESQDHEIPNVEIANAEVVTKTVEEPLEASTVKEISAVPTSLIGHDMGTMAVDVGTTTVNMAVNPISEVFPTTEQPVAEQPEKSKSSGLRLTTSNESATTDNSSASSDAILPASGRSRLESTSSSRFPGAWFSPSKTVDKSRPFLEIAQGEFTAKNLAAARELSIDEGPIVAEQSTETQAKANEEAQPASDERKSRWCVIM